MLLYSFMFTQNYSFLFCLIKEVFIDLYLNLDY
jgi:hypothetical protein